MFKYIRIIFVLGLVSVLISFCGGSSTDSGGGSDSEPAMYDLSSDVSPSDAGSITPGSGTYEEGEEVELTANTENSAWSFNKWTGDVESTDNPLTITMDSDTEVTANFDAVGSIYEFDLEMEDSLYSTDLAIGQLEGASEGFDSGMDHESPGAPPQGGDAIYLFLKVQDLELLKDFRTVQTGALTWNVQVGSMSGDSLTVNWNLKETVLNGALTIQKNEDTSTQVDMAGNSSASFQATESDSLLIKYQLSN
ncbi:InlB B-repeat-containing protein [Fodinibius halophilus]|uniref:Bacterial repeat domain-containing protein n=1 Tax=Fodinibius halophilus TaxID=1736908 RepID=A0A6M1TFU7_9BACT|nr:hypothetical protein [Fodinibius halophilus]NGP89664.1 hypothetical protein [Fodinibius halophilus]